MNQHQNESHHPIAAPTTRPLNSNCESRQRLETEAKDPVAARKVQKADRERLRRDRLNEQYNELGNAVDPDRPKNDKATILTDAIQLLKDLGAEVNRLQTECTALTEESRELIQEKTELREEKASLKSDIDNLNAQYQQRIRVMYPWGAVDPSVVMAPPPYTYPVPLAVPPGSIPMHPNMQPFSFFGSQNPGGIHPNHHPPPYVSYPAPANPPPEQQQQQQQSYASTSRPSTKRVLRTRSCSEDFEKTDDDSNNVATELELKTPGSSGQQESSPANKKAKQTLGKEKGAADGTSSSLLSSSQGTKECSSSSSMSHI